MKYLYGIDEIRAMQYIDLASGIATQSTCLRKKCGSLVVKDGLIVGAGFNSPPGEIESQRRCHLNKWDYDKKVTDKTCCVHAEQRAIINTLQKNSCKMVDSIIYVAKIDEREIIMPSGEPYCTICSKMVLDVGISRFVLLCNEGIREYNTEEYNDISFLFGKNIGCIKP